MVFLLRWRLLTLHGCGWLLLFDIWSPIRTLSMSLQTFAKIICLGDSGLASSLPISRSGQSADDAQDLGGFAPGPGCPTSGQRTRGGESLEPCLLTLGCYVVVSPLPLLTPFTTPKAKHCGNILCRPDVQIRFWGSRKILDNWLNGHTSFSSGLSLL